MSHEKLRLSLHEQINEYTYSLISSKEFISDSAFDDNHRTKGFQVE